MSAPSIRLAIRRASAFLFSRYPFLNGITILLLLAERAKSENYPPFNPQMIYGHVFMFIIVGVGMAFDIQRKNLAFMHAGQLLMLAFSTYNNDRLGYREWVKIRLVLRYVGMSGLYILYSFFITKPRNPNTRRIGEILVGVYLFALTYSLFESPEDKTAFVKLFPFGEYSLFVIGSITACCAMCWLPGYFVHDVTQVLVVILTLQFLFVDLVGFNYWTKKRGFEWWTTVRTAGDDFTIIMGFLLYLTFTKKKIYTSEADKEASARKVKIEVPDDEGEDEKSQ